MPSKPIVRRSAVADQLLGKSHKKARLDVKDTTKQRKSTPPPKHRATADEETVVPTSSKGKGKARDDTSPATKIPSKKAKKTSKPTLVPLPTAFTVITGSYEKLLYGLQGQVSVEGSQYKFTIKPVFIFPAHVSSIKAAAASPSGGKWLATGSADEIIKVWDLRRRKEIGGLMHHEGSITHLEFPSRSHLLSASEDGTLCLFRARDWAVLRTLKGHKGRVNSVAVHPSGKVALSVGKDRTLRMWDLMRGKGVASTKLGKEGETARWSTDGSLFVVQTQSTLDIYSTEMTLLHTITHPSRIHDIKFHRRVDGEGEVLFVAAEDKKLSVYDVPSDREKAPSIIAEMIGHSNRVKAVDALEVALLPNPESKRTSTTIVCTISSDGKILLFDMAAIPKDLPTGDERAQIQPVSEYDTKGSRLTCLALAGSDAVAGSVNGKRKRVDAEEGDDDDEEDDEDRPDEDWDSQQEEEEDEDEGSEDEEDDD
ncbi:hypothetical protein EIP91_011620 [Steccherinum ochraceum]|uniref:Uncharacterized protein n=1 Tax=Steccherinum ochraceum TaxID=92696 RepID=A0A4R0RRE0_9APHY|nr:hypothetical protein EIP91_011620 [Steccherinum ochraceum]